MLHSYYATLTVCEGPNHDFKRLDVTIDMDLFRPDTEEKRRLVAAFVTRILENACAALNARENFTLHFGIEDRSGRILGLIVKKAEFVRSNSSVYIYLMPGGSTICL